MFIIHAHFISKLKLTNVIWLTVGLLIADGQFNYPFRREEKEVTVRMEDGAWWKMKYDL